MRWLFNYISNLYARYQMWRLARQIDASDKCKPYTSAGHRSCKEAYPYIPEDKIEPKAEYGQTISCGSRKTYYNKSLLSGDEVSGGLEIRNNDECQSKLKALTDFKRKATNS